MVDEGGVKYDVFVSYRWVDPDKTWVRQQLVPALMNARLSVCLDVNDFTPGRDVFDEMTRAGTESSKGVCVISPDYFEGNRFVTFERNMLQRRDPSGLESRLIPLLFRKTNLPEQIRGLIPIDWTNPTDRIREWRKLLQVLGAKNLNAPDPESINQYRGLSYKEIEILNILKNFHGFGLYTIPHIPQEVLSTAKKVCEVPEDENILCLIILGPQKDYLLLGRNGIYFRSIFKSLHAATIQYTEFPSRTFSWGRNFYERATRIVRFGNGQFVIAIDISPDQLVNMLNAIKEALINSRLAEQ